MKLRSNLDLKDVAYLYSLENLVTSRSRHEEAKLNFSRSHSELNQARIRKASLREDEISNLKECNANKTELERLTESLTRYKRLRDEAESSRKIWKHESLIFHTNRQIYALRNKLRLNYSEKKGIETQTSAIRKEIRTTSEVCHEMQDQLRVSKKDFKAALLAVRHKSIDRVSSTERSWALKASEVPQEYRADSRVTKNYREQFHIHYGNMDRNKSQSNGHAVVEPSGKVSFHRRPGESQVYDYALEDDEMTIFIESLKRKK